MTTTSHESRRAQDGFGLIEVHAPLRYLSPLYWLNRGPLSAGYASLAVAAGVCKMPAG